MNPSTKMLLDLNFCATLLKKLKKLSKEDRVFSIGLKQAKKEKQARQHVTPISRLVILHLSKQLGTQLHEVNPSYDDLQEFISMAEEFINIFKKTAVSQPE